MDLEISVRCPGLILIIPDWNFEGYIEDFSEDETIVQLKDISRMEKVSYVHDIGIFTIEHLFEGFKESLIDETTNVFEDFKKEAWFYAQKTIALSEDIDTDIEANLIRIYNNIFCPELEQNAFAEFVWAGKVIGYYSFRTKEIIDVRR